MKKQFNELFPKEKENDGLFAEEIKRIHPKSKGNSKENSKENTKEITKENTKEIMKENLKEFIKEISDENSNEITKENINDAFRYSKMSEQQAENMYQERFLLIFHSNYK